MRRFVRYAAILAIICAATLTPAFGRGGLRGYAEQGGKILTTQSGMPLVQSAQRSFPGATVTVYYTGTTNVATIYSDAAGTSKSNPFAADANAFWSFYADDGDYDIRFSGTAIAPWTITALRVLSSTASIVVNVKDFGALGNWNGSTGADDTAAINAAINTNGNFSYQSVAREIWFPVGRYKITSTIEIPPNVTLRGFGEFSNGVTGSTIDVQFDGVGIRFVRRNKDSAGNKCPGVGGGHCGTSIWHMGGMVNMGITGTGSTGQSAATHLVDIGDSTGLGQGTNGTATANLTLGVVTSVTVNTGGTGYTSSVPIGFISLDNGTGAMGTATVAGGVVTGIVVTQGGSGYVTPPVVAIGYDPDIGAAKVLIDHVNFNFTAGTAIFFANGQECIVTKSRISDTGYGIYLRHVLASNHIGPANTFISTSVTAYSPTAIGILLRKGSGGGNVGTDIIGNYFAGWKTQLWAASVNQVTVTGNQFETANLSEINLNRLLPDATPEGTGNGTGCEQWVISGNTFLGWSNTIAGGVAIGLNNAFNNYIGPNGYQSPNAAANSAISMADGGIAPLTAYNTVYVPGKPNGAGLYMCSNGEGGNSTVPIITAGTTVTLQNSLVGTEWTQPRNLTGADIAVVGGGEAGRMWYRNDLKVPRYFDGAAARYIQTSVFGITDGVTFANLGTLPVIVNGVFTYCSDCTKATPCVGGGAGAFAKRIAGAWDCN